MGFCLPAVTGICVAHPGESVVCVTGEGSLQMNIQELQTIRQNRLPVKLFVINNQGYHSIRRLSRAICTTACRCGRGEPGLKFSGS